MNIVFDIYKSYFTMKHIKIFIDLTRLNKPIGFMLLFWPCSWGLALAYYYDQNLNFFLQNFILFFLGAVMMRSAGCIFNDIVDKDLDKKVLRTKNRPIASKKISIKKSLFYVLVLCLFSFSILIQFNKLTIFLGLGSMFLAFAYPFMKRITYWPQLFLGLTFNWGIIMAWTSIMNSISVEILVLYLAAIFWTLGYDTIYGVQDIEDDEIIGIKSTSIKFKKKIKPFVTLCYLLTTFLSASLFLDKMNLFLGLSLFLIFVFSLFYQINIFKTKSPKSCLKAFKSNNFSGLMLFLAFFMLSINLGLQ